MTPTFSPTGRPKLPPHVVPWLQLLYPVLVATNALGTILGMASAGNRGRR